jgi:sugar O-acyltransferase (sialic acid O-acetyltransferase NeuD family)
MPEQIVIFGAGGHAKVVVDAIEVVGSYEILFLADANPARLGTRLKHYLVRSEKEGLSAGASGLLSAFVAIGHNETRKRIAQAAKAGGFRLATVVHRAAVIASDTTLGEGTLVMPASVINASSVIGVNAIINTGAIIEHDCRVGNHTHIAPRATLCGGVEIGDDTLIGAGAIVLPGIKVGARAVVGAGALVLSDVPDGSITKGIPART